MIQKKILLVGAPAVGKTSLTKRFVDGIFDEKYLTTVGVKIDSKTIDLDQDTIKLIIWDVFGADSPDELPLRFMRGAEGVIIVADISRETTCEVAHEYVKQIKKNYPDVSYQIVLNKLDLIAADHLEELHQKFLNRDKQTILACAKNGEGVYQAFHALAQSLL